MDKCRYVIAKIKVIRRGDLNGNAPAYGYEPDMRLGVFESRKAAKANFMRLMDPAYVNAPDDFAAAHFDRQSRALGHHKVIKLDAAIAASKGTDNGEGVK
jgi:hypothetical protein